MKILRISLRNIASLAGNHTVDFTKAPLANAGLFSISGQMGSGKSTLLDALCLALFDETPRLTLVKGTAAMQDGDGTVQQNDVRNLLRRGCGEGYAEAAFVGVDGGVYTARWMTRRARGRSEGNLQASEHSLFRGNLSPGENGEHAVAGTPTEVKKAIVAKVGLSFEQFRRAVLLAQGDFATFLKAKDTERAEILQALTGTERFETISKAIFDRTRLEEAKLSDLRLKLGAAVPLSEEARAAALEEIQKAEGLYKDLEKQLAERKKQEQWFTVEASRRGQLLKVQDQVRACLGQVELDAPRARELQWVQTASIEARSQRQTEQEAARKLEAAAERSRKLLEEEGKLGAALEVTKNLHQTASNAQKEASKRQQEALGDIAKARALDVELSPLQEALGVAEREHLGAKEAFSKAEKALSTLNADLEKLKKQRLLLEKKIAEVSLFAPFAPEAGAWMERFKAEAKIFKKTQDFRRQLQLSRKDADRALKNLEQISGKLPALRAQKIAAEKTLGEARQKAESFNAAEILSQRRNAMDLQNALVALKSYLDTQKHALEEQTEREAWLQRLEAQIASDGVLQEDLRNVKIPAAQVSFDVARESLRLAEVASSEQALVLRQALMTGQACPVCGSCEHPNASGGNSVEEKMLAALKQGVRDKESTLQQLKADLSGLEPVLEDKKKQLTETKRALEAVAKRIKDLGSYTPASSECAAIWRMLGAQRDEELKRREDQVTDLLKSLDQKDEARIGAEKEAKVLQADFDQKQTNLAAAESAEKEAQNASANLAVACSKTQADLSVLESELATAYEAVRPVLEALKPSVEEYADPDFAFDGYDYEEDRGAYCTWFEKGANEWNLHSPKLAELGRLEVSKLEQVKPLVEARDAAQSALTARTEEQSKALSRLNEKKAARSKLLGGSSADDFERKITAALETTSNAESNARQKLTDGETALGSHRAVVAEHTKSVASLELQRSTAKAAMDAWLSEFSLSQGRALNRQELDVWLGRDARWVESERKSLQEAEEKLATARGQESTLQTQLDEHLRTRSGTDELETVKSEAARLAAELTSAGEEVDAKRVVIASDNERNRESGALKMELETQEKHALPWQKLNSLIGSRDGAKFRNIAQQWTLEILLKHANAQLNLLSGRYRLERLRDSLNLIVSDLEMGWQRSVHSLSGGESFLVSLGLALGLASLTSSRLLIESLFIDEGFGSLDTETLRIALNALSHLESQGRKVGVISHVSEMVDAIPVQVRVVRTAGGASKIVVALDQRLGT